MANYGYRGEQIVGNGKWNVIIAGGGGGTAGQVKAPSGTSTAPASAAFDTTGGVAGETLRLTEILVSAGTGAISVYDSINAAGATSSTLLWSKASVAVGDIYQFNLPSTNGLWISVAASTTITAVVG